MVPPARLGVQAGIESRHPSGFRKPQMYGKKVGAPCRNRTCGTRFRKPVLYPTELRGPRGCELLMRANAYIAVVG